MRTSTLMTVGFVTLVVSLIYAGPSLAQQVAGTNPASTITNSTDRVVLAGSEVPVMTVWNRGRGHGKWKGGHWRAKRGYGWRNPYWRYPGKYYTYCWGNGYRKVCKRYPYDWYH